ncbi:hypothetical protein Dimus_036467, partial [Dionaea muscipula]
VSTVIVADTYADTLVGDSVEFVKGLADPAMGGQQVPVGGVAMRLPSTDGRQQQPPLSTASSPMKGVTLGCCGGASPSVSERVLDGDRASDGGMA